ncbi:MAG TPA: hypothetical protein VFB16_00275 [Bauldia sp.]|nr:hypothetical protein [Bauldia sp.]
MRSGMTTCALLASLALVAPALAYDQTWYRAAGWSGEYPGGFTLTADARVMIRDAPDRDAPQAIACDLKAKATYHPWNEVRVKSDHLEFLSYSKIVPFAVKTPFVADVTSDPGNNDSRLKLKKGDRWNYLVYGAEGMFVMEYRGKRYSAGQELIDNSEALDQAAADTPQDEWLGLTCANGTRGWILRSDVAGTEPFTSPNITEYGRAEDAP